MATYSFTVPKSLFKKDFAIGMDFGSDLIKVAHTTLEGGLIRIHLTNFSSRQSKKCFQFLEGICKGKLRPNTDFTLCGVGISSHEKLFVDKLNIRPHVETEVSHTMDGFLFLAKNLPWNEFVLPRNTGVRSKAAHKTKSLMSVLVPAESGIFELGRSACGPTLVDDTEVAYLNDTKVKYPVMVCQDGAGHYIYKLEENGFYTFIGNGTIGGKTLLALGNIILGVKTYDEIVTLAAQGDARKIDVTLGEAAGSATDETYDSMATADSILFSFGRAAQGEDIANFRREDLAAGILSLVARANAREAFNDAMISGINQVFYVGGVAANNELARNIVEMEFFEKCYANPKKHVADCLFVKGGGHAAAIGCLVKNLQLI